ncbi:hypothetical protein DMENIID0001_140960 [Sergentomyia squamirostris]
MAESASKLAENACVQFGVLPDMTFVFPKEGDAKILAKKAKLSKNSEVFKTQFASGDSALIQITDISFDIFNAMLKYIYEGKITVKEDNFLELLYVARKYFLYGLTHEVITFGKNFINETNLDIYFEELEKFDIKILICHVKFVCYRNPLVIIKRLNFKSKADMRLLKIILNGNSLVCSEFDLYKEIIDMINRTAEDLPWDDVKTEFAKMIKLIRFPTMTVDQLIKCSKPPSLLTVQQVVDLLLWVQEKTYSDTLQLFSSSPRNNPIQPINKCSRCRGNSIRCSSCSNNY